MNPTALPHPPDQPDEPTAAELQAGLDYLFSFYEAGHRRQSGQFDRAVRSPEVFYRIASALGLLPAPDKTILVTGSKGKGTCARLTAHYLQQAGYRVGLVLTPEELSHLDRIRLNGQAISGRDFLASLAALKPALAQPVSQPHYYHPPTAIFLLVALHHFQQTGLDYLVIEGGRGAQFDEISQIAAAVGVITSVLPEHLSKLGPTLADVCADKFSLMRHCATLVCAPQAWAQAQAAGIAVPQTQLRLARAQASHDDARPSAAASSAPPPAWFDVANGLAQETLAALGVASPASSAPMALSPSCQRLDARLAPRLPSGTVVYLDGAITPQCLDLAYLRSAHCQPDAIVLGLSADKNIAAIQAFLQANQFSNLFHFQAAGDPSDSAAPATHYSGRFDKQHGLDAASVAALDALLRRHRRVYVIGVQVFLRAVRQALGVKALSGDTLAGQ